MKQAYKNIAVSLIVALSMLKRELIGDYLSGLVVGLGLAFLVYEINQYGFVNTFKVTSHKISFTTVRLLLTG